MDDAYPLYGEACLEGGGCIDAAFARRNWLWGGVAESGLLLLLDRMSVYRVRLVANEV